MSTKVQWYIQHYYKHYIHAHIHTYTRILLFHTYIELFISQCRVFYYRGKYIANILTQEEWVSNKLHFWATVTGDSFCNHKWPLSGLTLLVIDPILAHELSVCTVQHGCLGHIFISHSLLKVCSQTSIICHFLTTQTRIVRGDYLFQYMGASFHYKITIYNLKINTIRLYRVTDCEL